MDNYEGNMKTLILESFFLNCAKGQIITYPDKRTARTVLSKNIKSGSNIKAYIDVNEGLAWFEINGEKYDIDVKKADLKEG